MASYLSNIYNKYGDNNTLNVCQKLNLVYISNRIYLGNLDFLIGIYRVLVRDPFVWRVNVKIKNFVKLMTKKFDNESTLNVNRYNVNGVHIMINKI